MTRTISMALGAMALAGAAAAQDLPTCERFPVGEESYACQCGETAGTASIWGTDIYTSDSDICTAAVHSGVISNAGGAVLALAEEGQGEYTASRANGIESRSWGEYGSSFSLDPKGPRFVAGGTAPACGRFDPALEVLTCHCPAAASTGAVWGSGPYTADSDICAAAMHAGVLEGMERDVTVLALPGLERYSGSTRNGITTRDWGAYSDSFILNANE